MNNNVKYWCHETDMLMVFFIANVYKMYGVEKKEYLQ